MLLALMIGGIIFWILYYYFEGNHDGVFANEIKLFRNQLDQNAITNIEQQFIKHELAWHWYDAMEKALVKIVLSVLIYLLTHNLLFSFQMLLLSVGVRSVAHDFFISLKMGKGINHIGPDFLWWDRFLRRMQNRGINQYVIKLIPNLLLVIWILITINN